MAVHFMISVDTVTRRSISYHYDFFTVFYRLLWGPHLHHGLWSGNESSRVAQLQLTQRLAELAGIHGGESVLDVGSGMGGSSIYLARQFGCKTQGVTVSPLQAGWATQSARWHGVSERSRFRCQDVEQAQFPAESFDVVWSIECTEHLYDKPALFQNVAHWLKPGGRVAICAWLAGDDPQSPEQIRMVEDVCEGFFCPSLGTSQDYIAWMEAAGLTMRTVEDWTSRVWRTWELCQERIDRYRIRWLARLVSQETVLFLDRFDTILKAYQTGAMKYGCFIAEKPLTAMSPLDAP